MTFTFNGKTYPTDEDGYLENLADWTPEVATFLAAQDQLELSDAHWEVLNFLRDYYAEYELAPPMRILTKQIGRALGKDKGNSKYLYQLFPYGPAKQGCRYAGLPKPTGCL